MIQEKSKMNRISWTSHERRLLAEGVLQIRKIQPDLSLAKAVDLAQKSILEPSRHRNILTTSLVPWLVPEMESIERENSHEENREKLGLESVEMDDLIKEIFSRLENSIIQRVEDLVSKSLNEKAISVSIQSAMAKYLSSLGMEESKPSQEKAKKPMVLLVGLLPEQFRIVVKEFEEILDLRLWNLGDGSYSQLKSLSANSSVIFGMTDFMSHGVEKALKSTNPNCYRRFTGGLSTLRKLLEDFYLEQS